MPSTIIEPLVSCTASASGLITINAVASTAAFILLWLAMVFMLGPPFSARRSTGAALFPPRAGFGNGRA